jgi:hypothetical protein
LTKNSHPLKDANGQMSTQEIFRNSKELNRHAKKDEWIQKYNIVYQLVSKQKLVIMRNGNTLFLYKIEGPHAARMFIINADSPKQFFKNLEQFVLAMQQAGFTKVFGLTDDLPTVKIIQKLGFKHNYKTSIEKTGKSEDKNQSYEVTVSV